VVRLPGNTWLPLLAALTLAATLVLFLAKWRLAATIPFGVFLVLVAAMVWQSPRPTSGMASALQRGSRAAAPAADTVLARWGLLLFLCADTALFLSLLFAYFYLWISNADWPARDAAIPLAWALPGLLIPLAIAALALVPRRQPMTATSRGTAVRLLVAPAAAGLAMFWHWAMAAEQIAPLHSHAAASVSWVMLGFVWTHLAVGVAGAAFIAVRCLRHGDPGWIEADTALLDRWWIYCALLAVPAWCIVHLFPAAG
jgi:cytochrome c oxidase subunit I+III